MAATPGTVTQLLNNAILANTNNKTKTPKPKPTDDTTATETSSDTLTTIINFVIAYPWIPAGIVLIVLANIGWRKLTLRKNIAGQPFPPLGFTVKRILRLALIEDKTPVLNRPPKVAEKLTWLTWRRYWLLTLTLLTIVAFGITDRLPPSVDLGATIAAGAMILHGTGHMRRVFQIRHRILMQMFEVAAAECRYLKGAELNPWGYIQITKWRDLYSPDTTTIMFPPRYRSEDPKNREAFELNFNGTVSDSHTWTYTWESANNRVIAEPVPYITENAPYPFPDTHPWNEFPLGVGAGGKEVVLNVSVFPHTLLAGSTGSGKAIECSTKIPTPSGWIAMGDIKVGDQVFDENGQVCTVTWISDVNEQPELYQVVFSDGSVVEADAEHLWFTETKKVRESRNNSKRKRAERRLLISPDRQEALKRLANESTADSEITLAGLAQIANVHATSSWLVETADELGPVGEVQLERVFHYAAQTVRQTQRMRVYPAKRAWEALLARVADGAPTRRWEPVAARRPLLERLAASTPVGAEATVSEITKLMGLPNAMVTGDLLKTADVPCAVEQREVELDVPAKEVRRKGPWVRTYNTRALVAALLERVRTPAHDQRHKNTHGSVKTTSEILDTLGTASGHLNHAVPVAKPLDLPEVDLPIDPYVLGVWLGDGMSRSGSFCGIDHEIAHFVAAAGYDLVERRPQQSEERHSDFRIWRSARLREELRREGLLQMTTEEGTRKRIPEVYLRASIAQRRALLAGLLDTDGTVAPQGTVQFVSIHEHLARQVRELALTLGYRAGINSCVKRAQTGTEALAWTVSWTCPESPFFLTRKSATHRERNVNYCPERNETRFIVDVRKTDVVSARCIQVDSPSRLFLAGESMIPTHNSVTQRTILLHALQQPDVRVLLIDPKRVELSVYADHPHVLKIATELDESTQLLEQAEAEMQARYETMKNARVNFFKDLPDPPPALIIMVDEAFALLSPEGVKSDEGKERDEMHARCTVLLGSIARLGRAAGVHLIIATQRPDAKVIPGETRANLDARIAQGRMDTTPSLMTLDSDAATRLPPVKGRAVYRAGNETTEFQAYFLPPEYLGQVLEMSAAIATGVVSPEDLMDSGDGEGKRRSFRLPLPKGLGSRLSAWVAKRKAAVEVNEEEARRFAGQRKRKAGNRGGGKSRGAVAAPVEPLSPSSSVGAAEVPGVPRDGYVGDVTVEEAAVPVAARPPAETVVPPVRVEDFEPEDLLDDVDDFDVEEAPWMPDAADVESGSGGAVFGAPSPPPSDFQPAPPPRDSLDGGSGQQEGRGRRRGVVPPPPPG